MLVNGSDEFAIVDGLASDDIAKIVAFLANRQTQPVPLADNVYAVEIARAKLPAKLVAYDDAGRIVGITTSAALAPRACRRPCYAGEIATPLRSGRAGVAQQDGVRARQETVRSSARSRTGCRS